MKAKCIFPLMACTRGLRVYRRENLKFNEFAQGHRFSPNRESRALKKPSKLSTLIGANCRLFFIQC